MGVRAVLIGKLHRLTTTNSELPYVGSCAIDEDLLIAADIREYEQVEIYNVVYGECFTTYPIRGERASGVSLVNGAAVRKATAGDLLIIASYGVLSEHELKQFQPRLVYADARNRIVAERGAIPFRLLLESLPDECARFVRDTLVRLRHPSAECCRKRQRYVSNYGEVYGAIANHASIRHD